MAQYLISLSAHAMDHIPDEDMPAVAKAAHAVSKEAIDAGVFVGAEVGCQDRRRLPLRARGLGVRVRP